VPSGQAVQNVDVAGDERRFADNADREATITAERLKNPTRQAKLALGGLVGVGRCADDQGSATQLSRIERA
jgi:hypothetical protein